LEKIICLEKEEGIKAGVDVELVEDADAETGLAEVEAEAETGANNIRST